MNDPRTRVGSDGVRPPDRVNVGDEVTNETYSPLVRFYRSELADAGGLGSHHVRYLGTKGYTSPTGRKFCLYAYAIFENVEGGESEC